jgi:hypothetical protein
MIDQVLGLLRQELNDHLARTGDGAVDGGEDRVTFPNSEKPEPEFKLGAVTLMLAGLQEEPVLRAADRYAAMAADGSPMRVQPAVRLNLMLLVAARHRAYDQSLRALSQVIGWCQQHPVLDSATTPQLDPAIDRVTLELMTLTLAEQNELWSALGTGYLPSVLYRLRLVAFSDPAGRSATAVTQPNRELLHHAG